MNCAARRDVSRELEMVDLFKSGQTLQAIGDRFALTRERVRQLLSRHQVSREDGGYTKKRGALYGYTAEEFKEIERRFPKCAIRWIAQRNAAKNRGIEWKLTFREWIGIWDGHWEQRGRGHGMVMCRKRDQGAYEVGNVFIAPGTFNNAAYQIRKWHGVDIDADPYYAAPL